MRDRERMREMKGARREKNCIPIHFPQSMEVCLKIFSNFITVLSTYAEYVDEDN